MWREGGRTDHATSVARVLDGLLGRVSATICQWNLDLVRSGEQSRILRQAPRRSGAKAGEIGKRKASREEVSDLTGL
jgi:hypothetical protein